MASFITNPDQATPVWLTTTLREQGILPVGEVVSVVRENLGALVSTSVRLHLEYSQTSPPEAPKNLFIKFSSRANEIVFYQHLAYKMPDVPILKAISADYNADAQMGYLLFPDVTDEFEDYENQRPSEKQITLINQAWADIHTQWWNHPDLLENIKDISEDIYGFIHGVAVEAFPQFVNTAADLLKSHHLEFYEKLLSAWPFPALKRRYATGKNLTIVHGDTNYSNVLFSKSTPNKDILLIDWAVWHINLGPSDISYMGDNPEHTRLRTYFNRLLENGIQGYSWEDCLIDYKLSSIGHMIWPVFFWAFDLPEDIWRGALIDYLGMFDDLNLDELFD